MDRLLTVLFVVLASVLHLPARAGNVPSTSQCEALGQYRDNDLYREWTLASNKIATYKDAMAALDAAYADVSATKGNLMVADIAGSLAHTANAMANLTMNLATGIGGRRLQTAAYEWATHGKFAAEMVLGSEADRVVGIAEYFADAAVSASAVGRGAVAVKDLARDLQDMTDDLEESTGIRRQLDQQMSNLKRDAASLNGKLGTIEGAIASMVSIKGQIDRVCGSRGCPLPSSSTVSRKGSVMCLVSQQATCVGCKDGWRHRCDASPEGFVWKPVDECLPSEAQSAKARGNIHQDAAAMFSAQSSALASAPSDEERAERRRQAFTDAQVIRSAYPSAVSVPGPTAAVPSNTNWNDSGGGGEYDFDAATVYPGGGIGGSNYEFNGVDPKHPVSAIPQTGHVPPPGRLPQPMAPTASSWKDDKKLCPATGQMMDNWQCAYATLCKKGMASYCRDPYAKESP